MLLNPIIGLIYSLLYNIDITFKYIGKDFPYGMVDHTPPTHVTWPWHIRCRGPMAQLRLGWSSLQGFRAAKSLARRLRRVERSCVPETSFPPSLSLYIYIYICCTTFLFGYPVFLIVSQSFSWPHEVTYSFMVTVVTLTGVFSLVICNHRPTMINPMWRSPQLSCAGAEEESQKNPAEDEKVEKELQEKRKELQEKRNQLEENKRRWGINGRQTMVVKGQHMTTPPPSGQKNQSQNGWFLLNRSQKHSRHVACGFFTSGMLKAFLFSK